MVFSVLLVVDFTSDAMLDVSLSFLDNILDVFAGVDVGTTSCISPYRGTSISTESMAVSLSLSLALSVSIYSCISNGMSLDLLE